MVTRRSARAALVLVAALLSSCDGFKMPLLAGNLTRQHRFEVFSSELFCDLQDTCGGLDQRGWSYDDCLDGFEDAVYCDDDERYSMATGRDCLDEILEVTCWEIYEPLFDVAPSCEDVCR